MNFRLLILLQLACAASLRGQAAEIRLCKVKGEGCPRLHCDVNPSHCRVYTSDSGNDLLRVISTGPTVL
ncbi:hypothetical protein M404DRAFT_1001808 [Pisolithus tinctorius Marx 270]|uniref:Uncharacterized protein n=1 Tax=Pisolithus tinctorius Marx 270 TaxID=870435 RepID=A0A0C3J1E0_PISTI|nr:hypothetical protein M404DRAFT_1001808 [Pisolithus tinctorius Marx 270]